MAVFDIHMAFVRRTSIYQIENGPLVAISIFIVLIRIIDICVYVYTLAVTDNNDIDIAMDIPLKSNIPFHQFNIHVRFMFSIFKTTHT